MGGVAAPLPLAERTVFAAGALGASITWFTGFGYAVALLSSRLLTASFWRTVDLMSCCCMVFSALGIIWRHGLLPGVSAFIRTLP